MAVTGMQLGARQRRSFGDGIAQQLRRMLLRLNGTLDLDPEAAVRESRRLEFADEVREQTTVEFMLTGPQL